MHQNYHKYKAYGLHIESEVSIPEFETARFSKSDVSIILKRPERRPPRLRGLSGVRFEIAQQYSCLFWEDVGLFQIKNGNQITVSPFPGAYREIVRLPIASTCMALLLEQRGFLVIHGAALEINGAGIVLVGDKGYGKSTLTAYLLGSGGRLLSDDVTAISIDSNGAWIMPGFPSMKLWPDAINFLGRDADALKRIHPLVEKRAVPMTSNFATNPTRLRSLFFLGKADTIQLEQVDKAHRASTTHGWTIFCLSYKKNRQKGV
ncbi:Serine kinase of the HPr protein, regulates carbohydrate metabolism [Dissulfuribacter thermophilus]|uniref:Serine kinase of the HPr protein, regulates carbohydrate metabolism n=1 Tax=Dissulfuribacter thermophilus TaxID=1156395 RepID=A0A1B9F794_9BACT|nr:hypothetical protein [Dissulfuribacter thermophilus]OCC15631.1 Serine kinase of the HPr protein, regulates carbohydrate metabolism [Dissulfuribacter thermophilus]